MSIAIKCRGMLLLCGVLCSASVVASAEEKPLTAVEARKKVGEVVTVQMLVRGAKDRLEKRGEIYLDSELDFRDEKNFAVVITKQGALKLKEAGISNPVEHFGNKTIRATGKVKLVQDVPRIEIDAAGQIGFPAQKLIEKSIWCGRGWTEGKPRSAVSGVSLLTSLQPRPPIFPDPNFKTACQNPGS